MSVMLPISSAPSLQAVKSLSSLPHATSGRDLIASAVAVRVGIVASAAIIVVKKRRRVSEQLVVIKFPPTNYTGIPDIKLARAPSVETTYGPRVGRWLK